MSVNNLIVRIIDGKKTAKVNALILVRNAIKQIAETPRKIFFAIALSDI